jgi:hypothetical protein
MDQGTKRGSVSDGILNQNTAILDPNLLITKLKLHNGLPAMHSTSCGTEAEMLGSLMMLPSGVYSTHTVEDHHNLIVSIPDLVSLVRVLMKALSLSLPRIL